MKNKDLLKLIKTKSQEVNIKDFSAEIVAKARFLPQAEQLEAPKRRFQLKPSLAYSFTLLTAVVAFFVLYNPAIPMIPEIEDVNQVVALSSVTAVSLIEYTDQQIEQNDTVSLSLGYVMLDMPTIPMIDDEIDDVSMYLGTMEKLLNSADNFDYQFSTTNPNGYDNHLSFFAKDLLDTEIEYVFNFNQTENSNTNRYQIEGIIEIDSIAYAVTAHYELDHPQNVVMKIEKDSNNYIEIAYGISETESKYELTITEDGIKLQTAHLYMRQINNQKSVYLDFVNGRSIGSYAFKVTEENLVRSMQISYYIPGSTSESGEIDVTVDTTGATIQYAMTIKPQGRVPYIIERGRPNDRDSGHGNGNPGGSNH